MAQQVKLSAPHWHPISRLVHSSFQLPANVLGRPEYPGTYKEERDPDGVPSFQLQLSPALATVAT